MGGERVRARKKNRQLISVSDGVGGGGNGIAVLLMFGGALAAAAFVAAASFAFNKNKKKDAAIHPKPKPQHQLSLDNSEEDDHQIENIQEGLRALLQPSTTPTNDGDASAPGHGGVDMRRTINNTCITEEKIDAVPDHGNVSEEVQEVVLSDDSKLESDGEAQDVEVEPQEDIQQSVELETESQGASEIVSEIDKEEDIENGDDKMDTTDATIGWVSVTGEASSDEKDSDEPSAQGGEVVSEIDKEEDGSLLNSNENQDFCHAHVDFSFKGGKMDIQNGEDKIDTTDAAIEAVTVTHEASSDEKDSDQSSSASHSFQFSTRVIPFLLLPLLFLILFLVDRTHQFFL